MLRKSREVKIEWLNSEGKSQEEWIKTRELTVFHAMAAAKRAVSIRESADTLMRVVTIRDG